MEQSQPLLRFYLFVSLWPSWLISGNNESSLKHRSHAQLPGDA